MAAAAPTSALQAVQRAALLFSAPDSRAALLSAITQVKLNQIGSVGSSPWGQSGAASTLAASSHQ